MSNSVTKKVRSWGIFGIVFVFLSLWTASGAIAGPFSPVITTVSLPSATVGVFYSASVAATGTPAPMFSVSGALPAGLSFNTSTGEISGNPTASGSATFTITADNGNPPPASAIFTILTGVPPTVPPVITTVSLPSATVGVFYSASVAATGTPAPMFSVSGALPAGLSFNTSTGEISGNPTASGSATFTITADNGSPPLDSAAFTLIVDPPAIVPPVITSVSEPVQADDGSYSVMFFATGSPYPTFSITSGQLPPGFSFNTLTGELFGIPTTSGSYSFVVTASNGGFPVSNFAYTFTVTDSVDPAPAAPVVPQINFFGFFDETETVSPQPTVAQNSSNVIPSQPQVASVQKTIGTGGLISQKAPQVIPTGEQAPAVSSSSGGWDIPTSFSKALRTVQDLPLDSPIFWATIGATMLGFMVLLAIPAELLESTVGQNYERFPLRLQRAGRALARLRNKAPAAKKPWIGQIVLISLTAVASAFVDPNFGFNPQSFRLILSMAIMLAIVNYVGMAVTHFQATKKYGGFTAVSLKPLAIILTIAGVLFSRVIGIEPGLLFGLIMGIEVGRITSRSARGKLTLVSSAALLALGGISWLGYSMLAPSLQSNPTFGSLLAGEVLTGVTVESITAMVVALLPLTFLEGKTIFAWSKMSWAALYAVAIAMFAVILSPLPGTWDQFSLALTPITITLGCFTLFSFAFWLYFRVRFGSEDAPTVEEDQLHPVSQNSEAESREAQNSEPELALRR